MGKNKTPAPDPRIAEAAMNQSRLGGEYLDWMKKQAAITNGWAQQAHNRYENKFIPVENKFIRQAEDWDSPERMAQRVDQSRAAAARGIATGQAMQERNMASMGVNPKSGAAAALSASTGLQSGLALAGAENTATRDVRAEADARQAAVINMGHGLAVTPTQGMSMSQGAMSSGFQGAQAGLQGQGQLLQQNYQNQLSAAQMVNQQSSDLWGGIGGIVGLAFGSDENTKTKIKAPGRSLLDAVDNMPVKDWTYKEGAGDGGRHIGTMSQDFKAQTGMGDGKTINVIDAIGTVMGAVQELSAKVKTIQGGKGLPAESKTSAKPAATRPAPRKTSPGRGLPQEMKMAA